MRVLKKNRIKNDKKAVVEKSATAFFMDKYIGESINEER